MRDDNEQMRILADNLWKYMENGLSNRLSNYVSFFRAQVRRDAGDPVVGANTMTVIRPMDNTPLTLPCSNGIANAAAGSQVTVFVLGDLSNAFVISDGMMRTL